METETIMLRRGTSELIANPLQESVDNLKEDAVATQEEMAALTVRVANLENPHYTSGYLKSKFGGKRIMVTATPHTFNNIVMCEQCNQPMVKDTSKVLTTYPPMWEYRCGRCGCITYKTY